MKKSQKLAVALSQMGSMLQTQNQPNEARAALEESLTIIRRLAEQDPGNSDLQRGLALACLRLARSEKRRGNDEALKLYEESLSILTDLVARAPRFVTWQQEMEVVEKELKALREEQAKV